ncbi:MAG TPA: response regulator transcription factor [Streptosporangiaceae bacterium]|nr:response regulator transcription factor [Streptosporangiaceae bacterium]
MRVLIVDDHPIARRGLQMIVSEAFGATDCAEAPDAATALAVAARLCPDLLLLDMHMPGDIPAPVLCGRLRSMLPAAKVVIVTAFERSDEIRDCLVAGADGCLLKDTSEADMAASLRAVVTGSTALDSRIAFSLARDLAAAEPGPGPTGAPNLSSREQDVLCLLAEGCSNRVIARRLGLSEATVKGHVSKLLEKLTASSRLDAVVRAYGAGLI